MRVSLQAITLIILIGTVLVLAVSEVPQLSPSFGSQTQKLSPYLAAEFEKSDLVVVDVWTDNKKITKKNYDRIVNSIGKEKVTSDFYPDGFVAKISQRELMILLKDKNVIAIDPSFEYGLILQDAVEITGVEQMWIEDIQVYGIPLTGEQQTVCVIDTGIDFTHPDLQGKNALNPEGNELLKCYEGTGCVVDSTITDLNGHGTHMAGIIASQGNINGISKGSNLIGLKIFNGSASGPISALPIKRAIEWCRNNAEEYNIGVISMSIGTSTFLSESNCDSTYSPTSGLSQAISDAFDDGISMVAGAGNNADHTAISSPACFTKVIPVSATYKDDTLWTTVVPGLGSNYNGLVKLFAPGVGINSTCISSQGTYCLKTGTSASTAMVSGSISVINQFLEATGQTRTPHEIEDLLSGNGQTLIFGGSPFTRINVLNTILDMDSVAPEVNLMEPVDSYIFDESADLLTSSYEFQCSATDWSLNQIELEVYYDGVLMDIGLGPESLTGNSDTHTFTVSASIFSPYLTEDAPVITGEGYAENTFEWNCKATDSNQNSGEADQDYSFTIKKLIVESA